MSLPLLLMQVDLFACGALQPRHHNNRNGTRRQAPTRIMKVVVGIVPTAAGMLLVPIITAFVVQVSDAAVKRLPGDASLVAVERSVADAIRRSCRDFNQRRPDVIVIAHEMDPR